MWKRFDGQSLGEGGEGDEGGGGGAKVELILLCSGGWRTWVESQGRVDGASNRKLVL